jgi:hypothetical protein
LKSGWADLFWKSKVKRRLISTRVQRRRLLFQARVLIPIPMAAKDRAGF